jgi:DNA-directed RNA polymerase subunit RPC12/RpoP
MTIQVFECPHCGSRTVEENIAVHTARTFSHRTDYDTYYYAEPWHLNALDMEHVTVEEYLCLQCGRTWKSYDAMQDAGAIKEIEESMFGKWLEEERLH